MIVTSVPPVVGPAAGLTPVTTGRAVTLTTRAPLALLAA